MPESLSRPSGASNSNVHGHIHGRGLPLIIATPEALKKTR
jgi:hypothetical protein